MSLTTLPQDSARTTRLTALVSDKDAEQIGRHAAAANLSVSAYLRDRALHPADATDDPAALSRVDALIDRMQNDLDGAIATLSATLARMNAAA